jgi:hypothetical protein
MVHRTTFVQEYDVEDSIHLLGKHGGTAAIAKSTAESSLFWECMQTL